MHFLLYLRWHLGEVFPMITGGRVYPVRHYPVAIRLRDRKGRAILCVALIPQSGDFSGATLGVRSVALLHAKCSPYYSSLERFCCTFGRRLVPKHNSPESTFAKCWTYYSSLEIIYKNRLHLFHIPLHTYSQASFLQVYSVL